MRPEESPEKLRGFFTSLSSVQNDSLPSTMKLINTLLAATLVAPLHAAERPNILWIFSDDQGPDLGCYGLDFIILRGGAKGQIEAFVEAEARL